MRLPGRLSWLSAMRMAWGSWWCGWTGRLSAEDDLFAGKEVGRQEQEHQCKHGRGFRSGHHMDHCASLSAHDAGGLRILAQNWNRRHPRAVANRIERRNHTGQHGQEHEVS